MKEKCLFCDENLEIEIKNLIVYFDCMDHGWYCVSERSHSSKDLRAWAQNSAQDLVPVILHHNRDTGCVFPIPDYWVGTKVTVRFRDPTPTPPTDEV